MKAPAASVRRLRIDRLELDLRGIAPATAEAAARALGPALAKELAPRLADITPTDRIDAGRIVSSTSPGAHDLAAGIAERIASTIRREGA